MIGTRRGPDTNTWDKHAARKHKQTGNQFCSKIRTNKVYLIAKWNTVLIQYS